MISYISDGHCSYILSSAAFRFIELSSRKTGLELLMATTTEPGAAMHPDLEKTASKRSRTHSNVPDDALLAGEADAELLGKSLKWQTRVI